MYIHRRTKTSIIEHIRLGKVGTGRCIEPNTAPPTCSNLIDYNRIRIPNRLRPGEQVVHNIKDAPPMTARADPANPYAMPQFLRICAKSELSHRLLHIAESRDRACSQTNGPGVKVPHTL